MSFLLQKNNTKKVLFSTEKKKKNNEKIQKRVCPMGSLLQTPPAAVHPHCCLELPGPPSSPPAAGSAPGWRPDRRLGEPKTDVKKRGFFPAVGLVGWLVGWLGFFSGLVGWLGVFLWFWSVFFNGFLCFFFGVFFSFVFA